MSNVAVLVADPGSVYVGLVGQDQGGPLRRDRLSDPLLVVADGAEDDPDLLVRHAELAQDLVRDGGSGLGMAGAGDEVAHVVEVAGDRGTFGLPMLVAEALQQPAGVRGAILAWRKPCSV